MKIEINSAYKAYAKNSVQQAQQERAAQKNGKTENGQRDRVSISASAHRNDFEKTVYNAAAQLEAQASPARLGELKQAVQSGSYSVPAEKLADSILNTLI